MPAPQRAPELRSTSLTFEIDEVGIAIRLPRTDNPVVESAVTYRFFNSIVLPPSR